jgi:hypothetical protein
MQFKRCYLVKICLMMKIKFFAKNCCVKFYFASIFQSAQHIYEKGKDPDQDPYL